LIVCAVLVFVFIPFEQSAAARWLMERHDNLRSRARCPLVRRLELPTTRTNSPLIYAYTMDAFSITSSSEFRVVQILIHIFHAHVRQSRS
jgi:hypothetical protein